ncbi:uncharacterized protein LOC62_04G006159 [Vanrija pseudolonga]|uniref:RRM domain-containing protein n=1 Tax=Vanrija pseudolonga TaxID=143232 RepID=A0AAF1BIU3_9TREE|nr:hypothetical protein LOC62_04G006159 [Vanrija pseudolonga]
MSRAKPYSRKPAAGDPDSQWSHDLYDASRTTLADRLSGSGSGSSSKASSRSAAGPRSSSSSSLLDRLGSSSAGRELLPSSPLVGGSSSSKLHGFTSNAPISANAGKELLPGNGKAARSARNSRPRGGAVDAGQRNLVASSLGAALLSNNSRRAETSVSIFGAARASTTWVRVERLAKGTTAEDVLSAFAPAPILNTRVLSRNADRTATIELELAERAAADALVAQYDGVFADGDRLRLSIKTRGGGQQQQQRNGGGRAPAPASGKLYSDRVDQRPSAVAGAPASGGASLASRLSRR